MAIVSSLLKVFRKCISKWNILVVVVGLVAIAVGKSLVAIRKTPIDSTDPDIITRKIGIVLLFMGTLMTVIGMIVMSFGLWRQECRKTRYEFLTGEI